MYKNYCHIGKNPGVETFYSFSPLSITTFAIDFREEEGEEENKCLSPLLLFYSKGLSVRGAKGVLKTSAWYFSYAMLMRPKRAETSVCPWLLIDWVRWLCACVMCWPHLVGVSVCHRAFIFVSVSAAQERNKWRVNIRNP